MQKESKEEDPLNYIITTNTEEQTYTNMCYTPYYLYVHDQIGTELAKYTKNEKYIRRGVCVSKLIAH